jgi:hypothetical protein
VWHNTASDIMVPMCESSYPTPYFQVL